MWAPSESASAMKMILLVARRLEVEGAAGAGADDLDDRGALGVLEHVADRGLLDVEDLAADGQQRLELGVAGQLGGAERGVALDDEQLGAVVGGAAVGELGRQRRGLQGVLAALGLAVLAGGDPGLGGGRDLLHDQPGLGLLGPLGRGEELLELGRRRPCVRRLRTCGVPRISLVWPSNCGSASRTVTTAVSPSRTSSLVTSSSLTLSTLAPFIASLKVRSSPCSKPLTWVPPLGVAMTLTKERSSVS